MDDHSFDKIIKDKLDQYEDPSFDPAALAGFHDKLASLQPAPWYEQRISHYLVAASVTLFTVVNAYLFWPKEESALPIVSEKKIEQTTIDSLANVIETLQSENRMALLERDSSLAVPQHFKLQAADNLQLPLAVTQKNQPLTGKVSLGLISSLPPHLYSVLMEKGLLITENNEAFLAGPEDVNQHYRMLYLASKNSEEKNSRLPELTLPDIEFKGLALQTSSAPKKTTQHQISAKMRNEIEKHYFTGLGIAIAPHVDLSNTIFSNGIGGLAPRLGITADWIVSPRWSFETSVDYLKTKVSLDDNFQTSFLPIPDSTLGEVESLKIKNTLISLPLAIKYRQWLSEKTEAFVKVGYTPYFSIHQEYQWQHDFFYKSPDPNPFPNPKPNPDPDHDHHHITSVQENNNRGFYGGTGTASVGLTKLFKNKHKVEASLFYEKSLAAVGQEKLDMQLFGLRTAYWFTLR